MRRQPPETLDDSGQRCVASSVRLGAEEDPVANQATSGVVVGAEGLAKLVGVTKLVPTAALIERILTAVVREGARLDADATKAFGGLVGEYASTAPKAAETIGDIFVKQLSGLDSAAQVRLVDIWNVIGNLPVDPAVRDKMAQQALEISARQNERDHQVLGTIAKGAMATVGGILLIATAAMGYKHARPPTFWEGIFGKR